MWPSIFLLFLYFLFMTSSPTWLHVSHGIHFPHMTNCEPFFQVDHMALPSVTLLGCHVASPNLAICHPIPHASKNVKSQLPRNPTKFDVVAKSRETISTEKSVSSSEIEKHFSFSIEITILPFIQNHGFFGVSQTACSKPCRALTPDIHDVPMHVRCNATEFYLLIFHACIYQYYFHKNCMDFSNKN